MTIKVVAISVNDYKFAPALYIRRIMEENMDEIGPLLEQYDQAQAYTPNLQLKMAEIVRKDLTVFEDEESEHFLPEIIYKDGYDYGLRKRIRIEDERIALYSRSDEATKLYLSTFDYEMRQYVVHKGIKVKFR